MSEDKNSRNSIKNICIECLVSIDKLGLCPFTSVIQKSVVARLHAIKKNFLRILLTAIDNDSSNDSVMMRKERKIKRA